MLGNALGLGPLRSKVWVNLIRFVLYLQLYSRILEAELIHKKEGYRASINNKKFVNLIQLYFYHVNECCKGAGSRLGVLRMLAKKASSCAASTPPSSCQNVDAEVCCIARS
jgi:hypothetical protein